MKYRLTYVCPLCGIRLVDKEVEGTPEMAMEWVKRDIKYRRDGLDRFLDFEEYIPHQCLDGSVGMARIAGFTAEAKIGEQNGI